MNSSAPTWKNSASFLACCFVIARLPARIFREPWALTRVAAAGTQGSLGGCAIRPLLTILTPQGFHMWNHLVKSLARLWRECDFDSLRPLGVWRG